MKNIWTDNLRIEFSIVDEINISPDTVINKPITKDSIPIGIITESKLDESGLLINCKGVIWDRFIRISVKGIEKNKKFSLDSIEIK